MGSFRRAIAALAIMTAASAGMSAVLEQVPSHDGQTDVCRPVGNESLAAFVAANPSLRSDDEDDQLSAFRARGRLEWIKLLLPVGPSLGIPNIQREKLAPEIVKAADGSSHIEVVTQTMTTSAAIEFFGFEDRDNDDGKNLILPASNPLPLMAEFTRAYQQVTQGETGEGMERADAALASARAKWGARDPGLTLGHLALAEGYLRLHDPVKAVADANLGLELIAASPERAIPLSWARLKLLSVILNAPGALEIVDDGPGTDPLMRVLATAAVEANAEVRAELAARALALGSPAMDPFLVAPGIQPYASWVLSKTRAVAPMNIPELSMLGVIAATMPKASASNLADAAAANAASLFDSGVRCVHEASEAADEGDVVRSNAASMGLIALFNEGNAKLLARHLGQRADGDETWDDAVGKLGDDDSVELAGLLLYTQGRMPMLAERLEASITPASGRAWFEGRMHRPEGKATAAAARRYGSDLRKALIYARTAIALTLRPSRPDDLATMADASRWLDHGGAARVAAFLDAARVEVADTGTASAALISWKGRFATAFGAGLLDAIGWTEARAQGDERQAGHFEARLFERLKPFALSEERGSASTRVALGLLTSADAPAAQRATRGLPPLALALTNATLRNEHRAGESGKEGEADDDVRTAVSVGAAALLIPPAYEDSMWSEIELLGDAPARKLAERVSAQGGVIDYHNLDHQGDLAVLEKPLAYWLIAKLRLHKGFEAIAFLHRMLPTGLMKAKAGDQDLLATLFGDELLAAATQVCVDQARWDEALWFAGLRVRGQGLRAADPTPVLAADGTLVPVEALVPFRSPSEDLVRIARHVAPTPELWDDLLSAMEIGRSNSVERSALLRAAVARSGPAAGTAYANLMAASAQRRQCGQDRLSLLARPIMSLRRCNEWSAALFEREARTKLREVLQAPALELLSGRADLAKLQGAMHPGDLVVSTMVVDDDVVVLTITKDREPKLTTAAAPYSRLAELERMTNARFDAPDRSAAAAGWDERELEELYAGLLTPIAEQLGAAHAMLWSPDRRLAAIPIAALKVPATAGVPPRYLGLEKPTAFVPSLAALQAEPEQADTSGALVVGDIPYTGTSAAKGSLAGLRLADVMSQPPTTMAAGAISSFVLATGGRALTGRAATVDALTRIEPQSADLLMFYAHGFGSRSRLGPSLILAPALDGAASDALLRPEDVLRMRLRPRLVILAACSTGEAANAAAQPYVGLVESFLALGAQAVLSAQHPVDEVATAHLLGTMVPRLVRRDAPAEALRAAAATLAADPRTRSPLYWGQLVWVGRAT